MAGTREPKKHMSYGSPRDPNKPGEGLGLCYTFGNIVQIPEEVNCKKCLNKMESAKVEKSSKAP